MSTQEIVKGKRGRKSKKELMASLGMADTTAIKEPIAAVASAAPARPRLAILFPSSAVITEPDSPGVLSRIDVVDPPYMAP